MSKTIKYLLISMLTAFINDIHSGASKGKESMASNLEKLVFVDVQKILPSSDDPSTLSRGSKEWSDLMMALSTSLKSGDEEIQEMNESYTNLKTDFSKLSKEFESFQKAGVGNPKTLQEKQTVLQTKYEEIAKLEYQLQGKMQKRQELINKEIKRAQEILAPKLERIIEDIRLDKDLYVLRKEAVISAPKNSDITNQVLDILNKNYVEELKAKKNKKDTSKEAKPSSLKAG